MTINELKTLWATLEESRVASNLPEDTPLYFEDVWGRLHDLDRVALTDIMLNDDKPFVRNNKYLVIDIKRIGSGEEVNL